jgi:acyl-CoA reductase-like NAD-dependent aldehyde dehydrogenase
LKLAVDVVSHVTFGIHPVLAQGGTMEIISMKIGDEWRTGSGAFDSIDPYTGEPWASVAEAGKNDVEDAVVAARTAFDSGEWGSLSGQERGRLLRALGEAINESATDLALCETRDNGKLLREMEGQIRGLPAWFDYYAGLADKIDGRVVDTGRPDYFGYVSREPVGVIAAILPWNSPLLLLTFKLAAALAAGCTVVAKPSEQASVSVLRFAELFEKAGFPPGVFNTVSGQSRQVGEWLVGNPGVDHVSFTGSEATGAAVAAAAASHIAGATLELGGKSSNIVFRDANIEGAVNGVIAGIFAASGQTCVAGSRALVQREVFDEVVDRVVERAATIKLGDPTDPITEMGPICFPGQLEKIRRYVDQARREGATVRGAGDGGLGGLFFEPTIITGVSNKSAVCQEEIFGPVLSMLPFSDEAEAIAIANDSRYGLAAGIWTSDVQRVFRMTRSLRVGTVWVNAYRTLNYTMPFGGMKQSGFGRENGIEGLDEFLQKKAVWIELTGNTRDPFVLG